MHRNSQDRVFKQKALYRFVYLALTFCFIVAALVTTSLLFVGYHVKIVPLLCLLSYLHLFLFAYPSYALMGSVVVSDQWITYCNVWICRTIRFRDITELDVKRGRQHIGVKSPFGRIFCGPTYQDIDELIDLVESRVAPFLDSRRSELARASRNLPRFPVSVRIRWWQFPLSSFVLATGNLGFILWFGLRDIPEKGLTLTITLVLIILLPLIVVLYVMGSHYAIFGARRVVFGRRLLVIKSGVGLRTRSVDSVKRVYLREAEQNAIVTRKLVLEFHGARPLTIGERLVNVPIVPLYELLCKTYWPEGYREPGV